MSKFSRNIVANFGGGVWTALMSVLFVPLYIRYLGMEAYGLVGFFATLQAVFGILDMGLKNTLSREMARLDGSDEAAQRARDVLRTLELPYWGVALFIGAVIVGGSNWIANRWINSGTLSPKSVANAVAIIGIVIALRWPLSFYSGGLQGLQRQVLLNVINGVSATIRGFGSVLVLWLVSPTIEAFFIFQAVISVAHSATIAVCTWRSLPPSTAIPQFRLQILRDLSRFALGVSGTTVLATILTQSDKVILSRMLPLQTFGYYTLASLIALSLFRLIHPVYVATYPRLTNLLAQGAYEELERVYHQGSRLISATALPVAIVIAVFSREVVLVWTLDATTADRVHVLVSMLVAGTALNGLMNIPYALQLAAGWTSLAFYMNLAALIVLLPLTILLTKWFGAVGAASTWLMLNALYVLVAMQLMHRRLLPSAKWRWYLRDVAIPMLVASGVAVASRLLLRPPNNLVLLAVYLGSVGVATVVATACSMTETRNMFLSRIRFVREVTLKFSGSAVS